jgi:hypothetical protein
MTKATTHFVEFQAVGTTNPSDMKSDRLAALKQPLTTG